MFASVARTSIRAPLARTLATAPTPRRPTYVRKSTATSKPSPAPVAAAAAAARPTPAPAPKPTASKHEELDFVDYPGEIEMEMNLPDAPPPLPPVSRAHPTSGPLPSAINAVPFPSNTQVVSEGQTAVEGSAGEAPAAVDWSTSFHGISSAPFSQKQADILMRPLEPSEIEIKPDGLLYLPEIRYRRILNQAFLPGGWGMVPRGEMTVLKGLVTREWGLVAGGRLISVARGEQTFFDTANGLPTATEGCKSNALMRCCKDLGIASELWDPAFIRKFKHDHCVEAWVEHASTKKKQRRWRKKGLKFEYPYVESK
ncbi:hypothetical protein MNV49_003935 [Pseudohyphozyma bogoriensis]|nr:hypothetical protein MNV49_003935 [Pseudohyphozyma bogoriensis]